MLPDADVEVGTASTDAAVEPSAPAGDDKKEKLKFKVETLDQFADQPPQPWIIKGVLPQAGLAVVYGESGSGKSFFTLDMGASIARGVLWQGKKVRQGKVVYVVAEGAGGFRNRVKAYCAQHRVKMGDIPFGVINDAPNLVERSDAVALAKSIIHSGGASVIVVDTLAQTTPGANENSGEDMGKVLDHCRQIHRVTGALVLLVHHSGKDAAKGARGWSGLRAAADVEIEITRGDPIRTARISKQKDGEDGLHWNFTLETVPVGMDEDDDVITSCVIDFDVSQEPVVAKKALGPVQKLAMDVINELRQDQTTGIEVYAVVAEVVRRNEAKGRKSRPDSVKRSVEAMADEGHFTIEDGCIELGDTL